MTAAILQGAELGRSPTREGTRRLRIGYLTTEYPKVSHTFIRREIAELERRGHEIVRMSIRGSGGAIADQADRAEASRTFVCLDQPRLSVAAANLKLILTRPWQWLKALGTAISLGRRSERGTLRHIAYLAEAAVLLDRTRREGVGHVHVHFGTNAAAVALLMRRLGGPSFSLTIHGPDEFDAPRSFSLDQKVAEASFVIAISDFGSAQIRRWSRLADWPKIHVVHCTVGDEFLSEAAPAASGNTLLCIGRLAPQKGQLLLLEALACLVAEGSDAQLVLAGDGEMRDNIEQRISERGLSNRVIITGWIDEQTVRGHLRQARALVQPSFAEGLPVVIMEAMALGRPVIATSIAGIPELVQQGETGWLVPAGNVVELTRAMRRVLAASEDTLARMGAAGRKAVQERHFTATEVDKLEQLLLGAV